MDIIKTIPSGMLTAARGEFNNAGVVAAQAFAKADVARAGIIQRLLDYAVAEGIAPKVAIPDIMSEVVKPCTLTKEEQKQGMTPASTGKLAYSTGAAYAKSMEIAMLKGKPFAAGLYAAHLKEAQQSREAAHAAKVLTAEQAAKDAAAKAKSLAAKAARSKSVEVKLAAEQAKLAAEQAQEAVRAVVDKAPVSSKTGGKQAKKAGPAKVLTRYEIALHFATGLAMLENYGDEESKAAEEIAEILDGINMLVQ